MKSTKFIAISAVIAALYVVVGLPFTNFNTSAFLQIRPSEALTLLPLLFPPAILGVTVGCAITNLLFSSMWDVLIGSLITFCAAILTRKMKNVWLGGIFPVVLNAVCLPVMFLLLGFEGSYIMFFLSILLTQTIWVYGLGVPLYFTVKKFKNPMLNAKNNSAS